MFILNGNQELSVMTKACLTVRQKRQTGTKVGHNEPIDFLRESYRSSDKRYAGDNSLISSDSPYRRRSLRPRCRLWLSWV